jgi:PBSX family phage terminase large subunit
VTVRKSKTISRESAIDALWMAGELSWKLTDVQKIIKSGILDDTTKINVVLCSRRLGKSFLMCILALEQCLKHSGSIVKFVFPKQKDGKRNIFPLMKTILEDCPLSIMPRFLIADKAIQFHNGSEIQFSGCDNGNIDGIRGGFSHLNIVDEASYCDDLVYAIRSVLSPTTKTTGGRTILVSTPCLNSNHEFIQNFVLPYDAEGRIKKFTLYDNPNFTPEIIQEILLDFPAGDKDPMFRAEYLCEVTRDLDKSILPSFTMENESIVVRSNYERPVFYDAYVGMDIGSVDLTAVVFGYYDYLNATMVIEDELIFSKDVNTKTVTEAIKHKESQLWTNPIDKSVVPPYMRIADNSHLIMLTDMQRDYGITFHPTRKDNREAAINALDVALSQHKLIIHPRCTHTIYHMKFAEWNKTRTTFKNLKDSPSGEIKGGHADALAALIYLHRNIIKSKNPYPNGYGGLTGPVFNSQLKQPEASSGTAKSWLSGLKNWNKKKGG